MEITERMNEEDLHRQKKDLGRAAKYMLPVLSILIW